MTPLRSFGCAALIAAAGLGGCGRDEPTAAEIGRDIGEAVDDAAAKLREATRDFKDSASRRVDDVERKIEKLRDRPRTTTEEQSRMDKLLEDMRRMTDDIAAWLRELGHATSDKWDELKVKIERAIDDVERKIRDASS